MYGIRDVPLPIQPQRFAWVPFSMIMMGIFGAIVVLAATARWGVGLGFDEATYYMPAAHNLLAGNGLRWTDSQGILRPLVVFPPMYSIALAALGGLGLSIFDAARWLAAILFGLNAVAFGTVVHRNLLGPRWFGFGAAALFVASPIFVENHLTVRSEPLFYLFVILTWIVLAEYLDRPSPGLIVACGLTTALAGLTRYTGPALVGGVALALVLLDRRRWGRRGLGIGAYLAVAMTPIFLWYLRNHAVAGSAAGKPFAYHAIPKAAWVSGIETVAGWLAPPGLSFRLEVAIAGLVAVGFITLVVRRLFAGVLGGQLKASRPSRLLVMLVVSAACYAGLLLASEIFVDVSVRFSNRILSPVYLAVLLTLVATILSWLALQGSGFLRHAVLAVCMILLGTYLFRSAGLLLDMSSNGYGYSGREWRTSAAIAWLRTTPASTLIYSNEAAAIRFLTGLPARNIPETVDPVNQAARADLPASLAAMRAEIRSANGLLVIFPRTYLARIGYPPLEELTAGLLPAGGTDDATFYAASEQD